ncbi:MAG: ABC transporter substrate-binding protein [Pseudomonadota bacterium]
MISDWTPRLFATTRLAAPLLLVASVSSAQTATDDPAPIPAVSITEPEIQPDPAPTVYPGKLVENLLLQHQVQPEGDLPPIQDRVPVEPLVVYLAERGREPGLHGGTLKMFVSRSKDVRYMSVWGYARLVAYDDNYDLVPDILRDYRVEEGGRKVTLILRRGHKWSDGKPFTTEDLRYWWEDVALNEELSPAGPPVQLLADGKPPVVEVIDEVTISYTWPMPNPGFLPALAKARPVYIYRPAHYMKKYHKNYAPAAKLAERVESSGKKAWAALHNRKDNLYKNDNPKLPVLQPWVNTNKKNSKRYTLVRNPFYHRIDTEGRQLPYVENVELEIAASNLISAKAALGEATLQVRSLSFSNAPVLKAKQDENGFVTRLWQSGSASEVALYPNLNYVDPVWRGLFRDVRFRRALSLAISRKAINKVLYYGLAAERGVSALEESPFFNEERATAWARLDIEEANRLLDELGLTERNPAGIRRLPDGRLMEIIVETMGERKEVNDTLELITATWQQVGIRLLVKPLDREVMRNRAYAGKSMMVATNGWNIGIPTALNAPTELAPVDQATYTWPKWGQYYQTKGSAGEAPDIPEAVELMEQFERWSTASDDATKSAAWRRMLDIHADQVFCIGTVARAPIPLVHDAELRNVPAQGIYAWDPGGQLGVHRMDEFFFEGGRVR